MHFSHLFCLLRGGAWMSFFSLTPGCFFFSFLFFSSVNRCQTDEAVIVGKIAARVTMMAIGKITYISNTVNPPSVSSSNQLLAVDGVTAVLCFGTDPFTIPQI